MNKSAIIKEVEKIYAEIEIQTTLTEEEFDLLCQMSKLLIKNDIYLDFDIQDKTKKMLSDCLEKYKTRDNSEFREKILQEYQRIREQNEERERIIREKQEQVRKEQEERKRRIIEEQERLQARKLYRFESLEFGEDIIYIANEEIDEYKKKGYFFVPKRDELAKKILSCPIGGKFNHIKDRLTLISVEEYMD